MTTNLLQANPGVTGIFAENDEMARRDPGPGARAGKEVKVFGFDGTTDALKAIKAGRSPGVSPSSRRNSARRPSNWAAQLIKGQTVAATSPVPVTTITSANVGSVPEVSVVVVGSINVDLHLLVARHPQPGETSFAAGGTSPAARGQPGLRLALAGARTTMLGPWALTTRGTRP